MLTERKNVRQIKNECFRRWFFDEYFDLILWYENEEIIGFQLCYDKTDNERSLTWYRENGFLHNKIDDGESPYTNKMTPVLVADGLFDKNEIANNFRKSAIKLEYGVVDFIYTKLLEYS